MHCCNVQSYSWMKLPQQKQMSLKAIHPRTEAMWTKPAAERRWRGRYSGKCTCAYIPGSWDGQAGGANIMWRMHINHKLTHTSTHMHVHKHTYIYIHWRTHALPFLLRLKAILIKLDLMYVCISNSILESTRPKTLKKLVQTFDLATYRYMAAFISK